MGGGVGAQRKQRGIHCGGGKSDPAPWSGGAQRAGPTRRNGTLDIANFPGKEMLRMPTPLVPHRRLDAGQRDEDRLDMLDSRRVAHSRLDQAVPMVSEVAATKLPEDDQPKDRVRAPDHMSGA